MTTGVISSLKRPDFIAASALFWLAAENSSWACLVSPYFAARFSAVMPMWYPLKMSNSPSCTIESTISPFPMR
jgi:hypothetical protein